MVRNGSFPPAAVADLTHNLQKCTPQRTEKLSDSNLKFCQTEVICAIRVFFLRCRKPLGSVDPTTGPKTFGSYYRIMLLQEVQRTVYVCVHAYLLPVQMLLLRSDMVKPTSQVQRVEPRKYVQCGVRMEEVGEDDVGEKAECGENEDDAEKAAEAGNEELAREKEVLQSAFWPENMEINHHMCGASNITHVHTWAAGRSNSKTPDRLGSAGQSAYTRVYTGSELHGRC